LPFFAANIVEDLIDSDFCSDSHSATAAIMVKNKRPMAVVVKNRIGSLVVGDPRGAGS
jgi:hypothetical protein